MLTNPAISGMPAIPAAATPKAVIVSGIRRPMPAISLTMAAFAVAAAGMAGIPLVAGFVSKFYLLIGAVEAGGAASTVFAVALLISGVLNVAYFWPVVYQAFFQTADDHDAKPVVEAPFGGRRASTVARADGGSGDEETDDAGDADDDTNDADDADDTNDADNTDPDPDVDPEEIDRPEFGGEAVDRDYGEPAPRVEGEYAVDRHPSDHTVPEKGDADDDHEVDAGADHDGRDDHGDHSHHGGPPPGGWERRGWLGDESTWFMLGPILAATTGAIVLGLVPSAAVFLRLVDAVVEAVGVVG